MIRTLPKAQGARTMPLYKFVVFLSAASEGPLQQAGKIILSPRPEKRNTATGDILFLTVPMTYLPPAAFFFTAGLVKVFRQRAQTSTLFFLPPTLIFAEIKFTPKVRLVLLLEWLTLLPDDLCLLQI